jgi:protein-S-isoprenylcysteine O-methyltransferase Ste14
MSASGNSISKKKLFIKTLIFYAFSILLIGIMVFLPAGTLNYLNGWLFMAVLFIPMTFAFGYLYRNDPKLLQKRINYKERQASQKKLQKFSIPVYFLPIILAGLDFRFGWSKVPFWFVIVSLLVILSGYLMFLEVLKENSYASRTVEVQAGQKVIDTGLYSFVRHPMYLSVLIMYIFYPLALGSFYAVIPALSLPFILSYRIMEEEKLLMDELPGYREYMKKVKYRLLPYIW